MGADYRKKCNQTMLLVRVKPEIKERLRRLAELQGTTMTDIVRQQMRHFFIENNLPTPR